MKAMVLHETAPIEKAPLKLEDVPDPHPGEGEVRVKVRCCAVCRTDLHIIEGDLPKQKRPVIPGHQVVGVVDEIGKGCKRFKEGERIGIAWLRHACGQCKHCRRDHENLCESARFTGYHADGGYAEFAVVPEAFAYRVPQTFDDAAATPLLCAGIIGYRSLKRCNPREGCKLALYGFGSSAHVVMQIARHRGYEVYVVSRGEGHQQLARDMGAAWVGDDAADMPGKVDSAILFAPVGHLVPAALEMLDKGGALSIAGIYLTDVPKLEYETHLFYERDVHSVTCNTREDGRGLLEEAARIPIKPHTKRYTLEQANDALRDMKEDRINGTGVLVIQ